MIGIAFAEGTGAALQKENPEAALAAVVGKRWGKGKERARGHVRSDCSEPVSFWDIVGAWRDRNAIDAQATASDAQ